MKVFAVVLCIAGRNSKNSFGFFFFRYQAYFDADILNSAAGWERTLL